MNIDATTIYLWQLADKIQSSVSTGIVSSCVFGAVSIFVYLASLEANADKVTTISLKTCKFSVVSLLILALIEPFIPSSKTIAMMVVIPKITDSKVIQQDLPDLYNTALEALKANLSTK